MAFNNFGRELYDTALTQIARDVLLNKKKALVKLLDKHPDDIDSVLEGVARRSGRILKFEAIKQAIHWVKDYKKTVHYYVDNSTMATDRNYIVDVNNFLKIGSEYSIETNGVNTVDNSVIVLGNCTNLADDTDGFELVINGTKVTFAVDIFIKLCVKGKVCPIVYPIATTYILENGHFTFAWSPHHVLASTFEHNTAKVDIGDEHYECELIALNEHSFVKRLFEMLTFSATRIIEVRQTVKIKHRKASSTYESVHQPKSVDTVHDTVHVTYEDKLVPLQRYLYEYEPSSKHVSKGGHHASPVAHDRRGFYRKSRGKGDYDYVDGEFVYVGNREGSYSYVSPTRVNCKVNDTVIVYKV